MIRKPKISYNAPVVLSFVILCLIATVAGILTNSRSTQMVFSIYRGEITNPMTYLRCLTHVFGHTGFNHFLGNAMYLLLIGPMLEEKHGSGIMLKCFVLTAIVTGIIHCVLSNNTALCGASGIVFMCMILSSFTSFKEGEIPLSFILVTVFFIGQEVYAGITVSDNISNLTHILGGVVGGLSGYFLNKRS